MNPVYKQIYLALAIFIVLLSGCSKNKHDPKPFHYNPSFTNTQTRTMGDITVTVAVLSDQESEIVFEIPAVSRGVEPVWMKIENKGTVPYMLFPITIDENYYSPHEAARQVRYPLDDASHSEVMEYFERNEIKHFTNPGETTSGFIYTIADKGIRELAICLIGPNTVKRSYFVFPVPGIKVDFEDIDFEEMYHANEIMELDETSLHKALEDLQCCTTNEAGADGDPLNLVVIGEIDEFLPYFLKQGWEVTEDIYVSSLFKEVKAFFLGSSYKYAPVSSLYVFNRGQDMALQKPRENIFRRNHLRLWLSNMKYEGKPVWVGQVSRDIGVSFSTKNWWLSNHEIDPDIDEARNFLTQDILLTHGVKKFGYVRAMELASEEEPMRNFMDQPIYTDGLRAIFVFTDKHIDIVDLELFHWEWPFHYGELHNAFKEENIHKTQTK